MANQGSVTISGGSTPVTLTENSYASTHASMFSSMMSQVATAGFNSFSGTSNLLLVGDNLGNVALLGQASDGSSAIAVGDGTNFTYVGTSGNTTLVGGTGDAQIIAGTGNDVIDAGTGTDQIYLGVGSSAVTVEGASSVVQVGAGSASIIITGTGTTVDGGYGGGLLVDDSHGSGTVLNLVNNTTVLAASGTATTVNAFGNTTVSGSAGTITDYNQINGTLTFFGSGAGSTLSVNGAAGAGSDTLYAASGSNVYLSGPMPGDVLVANDTTKGGGGDVLLDGSQASGGNAFWAGSGNETLIGGTGTDTLVAGTGATSITGGSGALNYFDLFAHSASATVTITDFGSASGNLLTFFGFGASAVQSALAATEASTAQGPVTLSVGNATVILQNIAKSQLTSANVVGTDPSA